MSGDKRRPSFEYAIEIIALNTDVSWIDDPSSSPPTEANVIADLFSKTQRQVRNAILRVLKAEGER